MACGQSPTVLQLVAAPLDHVSQGVDGHVDDLSNLAVLAHHQRPSLSSGRRCSIDPAEAAHIKLPIECFGRRAHSKGLPRARMFQCWMPSKKWLIRACAGALATVVALLVRGRCQPKGPRMWQSTATAREVR